MRRRPVLALALGLLALASCTSARRCAYEGFGRDEWQQPARVVEALGLHPGDRVADLGSGSGYFTQRLAEAVGPEGRVYAVDIDTEMNAELRERLAQAGVANVEVIDARPYDPGLPDAGIDLVFSSDTYHHLGDRVAYFHALQRDLAPGGRVAILDYDGRGGGFVVHWMSHFTPRDVLLREMEQAGYEPVESFDWIDRQSFVIFRPLAGG